MERQNLARTQSSLVYRAGRLSQPCNIKKTPQEEESLLNAGHLSPALLLKVQPQPASQDSFLNHHCVDSSANAKSSSGEKEHLRVFALPESNQSCNRSTAGALFTLFPNSNVEKVPALRYKKTTTSAKKRISEVKAQQKVGKVMAVHRNRLIYIAKNNETPSTIASVLGIDCNSLISENLQAIGPNLCRTSRLRECTQVRLPIHIQQNKSQNGALPGKYLSSDPDKSNGRLMIEIKTDDHRTENLFPPATARIIDKHARPLKSIEEEEEEADAVYSSATSDPDAADALKALMMLTRVPARISQSNNQPKAPNVDAPLSSMHMNNQSLPQLSGKVAPSSAMRQATSASDADANVLPAPTLPQNPPSYPSSSPSRASPPAGVNVDSSAPPPEPPSCAQCFANAQESAQGITRNKYAGVTFHRKTKKWWAFIRVDSRLKHIGDFESEFEAAVAYDEHAARLGKALNNPKPPTACSNCGKVPPIMFRKSQPVSSVQPMPKPVSNDKNQLPIPETIPVPASNATQMCKATGTGKVLNDSENERSLRVSVTQTSSPIDKLPHSTQSEPPPLANFFVLRSDQVKRLYRIIAREGTDVKVEAISGPASASGKFCRAATSSTPRWVSVADVVEFFPKVVKSPAPVAKRISPQATKSSSVWPPNVDSKSAREILTSYLQYHNLDSRLAAAKPFVQRMAPFNEREMSIIKRGFVSGLVSGATNLRLFAKYFPSRRSTKKEGVRTSANGPEPTADDVELEAIGEESTALMRAPLRDDNGAATDSAPSDSFEEIDFSSAQGTPSFGFTPVAKKMRIGIEREDNSGSDSGDRPPEGEVLQLDDGDLEGIFFE